MFILKISHGKDIRRIAFPSPPTYDSLYGLTVSLFNLTGRHFSIRYLDEDNDLITVQSECELKEAIRLVFEDVGVKNQPYPPLANYGGDGGVPILRFFVVCLGDVPVLDVVEERGEELPQTPPISSSPTSPPPPTPTPSSPPTQSLSTPPSPPTTPSPPPTQPLSTPPTTPSPPSIQTEFDIVQQIQSYLTTVWYHVDDLMKPHVDTLAQLCDQGLSVMSSTCHDQFTSIKQFLTYGVHVEGLSFEDQFVKIQTEIIRLTQLLQRQLLLQNTGIMGNNNSGVRENNSGIRDNNSGVRENNSGVREKKCRIREKNCGIREKKSGIREKKSGNNSRSKGTNSRSKRTNKTSGIPTPPTIPLTPIFSGIPSVPPAELVNVSPILPKKREKLDDFEVVEKVILSPELSTLESMGFMDRERNQRLLGECNGDVALVVTLLLE